MKIHLKSLIFAAIIGQFLLRSATGSAVLQQVISGPVNSSDLQAQISALQQSLAALQASLAATAAVSAQPESKPSTQGFQVIPLPTQYLSDAPGRVYVVPNFLSQEERTALLEAAQSRYTPSEIYAEQSNPQEEESDGFAESLLRTSETAYLEAQDTSVPAQKASISALIQRAHTITMTPPHQGETVQATRYNGSAKYEFHYDSAMALGRVFTVLVPLIDVPQEHGGFTIFPRARIQPSAAALRALEPLTGVKYPPLKDPTWDDQALPELGWAHGEYQPPMQQFCDHPAVLRFRPRAGHALIWANHDTELGLDYMTLHGGCPMVEGGQKVIVQRWIRFYERTNSLLELIESCAG